MNNSFEEKATTARREAATDDGSSRHDGSLSSGLRSIWLVVTTVALLLFVGVILYFVIDPDFDKFSGGNDESSPTTHTESLMYSESNELCESFDFRNYESVLDVKVQPEKGDSSCDFRFERNGEELLLFSLIVDTSVLSNRSEARDAFEVYCKDANRDAADEGEVAGPWQQSLFTSSDKPYASYDLVVQDENLAVHIIQIYDPKKPLKKEKALEFLTDFARQTQKTLSSLSRT